MTKSRPPINFFVWIGISITLTIWLLIVGMPLIGVLIYGLIVIGILYMLLNTRDCRIEIFEDKLVINYLRPFLNREVHDLKNVDWIEFQKGKYPGFLAYQSDADRYVRGKDKLIIKRQQNDQMILINTWRSDIITIIEEFNKRNTVTDKS